MKHLSPDAWHPLSLLWKKIIFDTPGHLPASCILRFATQARVPAEQQLPPCPKTPSFCIAKRCGPNLDVSRIAGDVTSPLAPPPTSAFNRVTYQYLKAASFRTGGRPHRRPSPVRDYSRPPAW